VYFVVHQHPHSIRGDLCLSVVEKTSIAIRDCGSDGTSPSQKNASDSIRGFNKKFAHNRARARSVSRVLSPQICNLNSQPKYLSVASELSCEAMPWLPPINDHNNPDHRFEHVAIGNPGGSTRFAPLGL
jgi:hypothetical protein